MIPGIIASQASGHSEPPELIALADFTADSYFVGSTVYTAGDLIAQPGRIDSSGDGLSFDVAFESDGPCDIIGPLAALLLAQPIKLTMVIEYDDWGASHALNLFGLHRVLAGPTWDHILNLQRLSNANGKHIFMYNDNNVSEEYREIDTRFTDPLGVAMTTGIHRIAFTRSAIRLRSSIDGSAVFHPNGATDVAQPSSFIPDNVSLGGFSDDTFADIDFYIRKVEVYTPALDEWLPTLSELVSV